MKTPTGPVWDEARKAYDQRSDVGKKYGVYVGPEHVSAAIKAGASREDVWRNVLEAIEMGTVEDASCVCFVALKYDEEKLDGHS